MSSSTSSGKRKTTATELMFGSKAKDASGETNRNTVGPDSEETERDTLSGGDGAQERRSKSKEGEMQKVVDTQVYSELEKERKEDEGDKDAKEPSQKKKDDDDTLGPDTVHAGFSPVVEELNDDSSVRTIERTGSYIHYFPDAGHWTLARKLYGMSQREYLAHLRKNPTTTQPWIADVCA